MEMELSEQSQQRFNSFPLCFQFSNTGTQQVSIMHSCTVQCAEETLVPKPEKL